MNFLRIPRYLTDDADLSAQLKGSDWLVIAHLGALLMPNTWTAWATADTIARRAGVNASTVKRSISRLRAMGILVKPGRGRLGFADPMGASTPVTSTAHRGRTAPVEDENGRTDAPVENENKGSGAPVENGNRCSPAPENRGNPAPIGECLGGGDATRNGAAVRQNGCSPAPHTRSIFKKHFQEGAAERLARMGFGAGEVGDTMAALGESTVRLVLDSLEAYAVGEIKSPVGWVRAMLDKAGRGEFQAHPKVIAQRTADLAARAAERDRERARAEREHAQRLSAQSMAEVDAAVDALPQGVFERALDDLATRDDIVGQMAAKAKREGTARTNRVIKTAVVDRLQRHSAVHGKAVMA